MKAMNPKQFVILVGSILIASGLIGLVGSNDSPIPQTADGSDSQSTLEVKRGNNLPTSTIDYIQGSGNLQGQGSQPQSANAGGQLQPNAGADSLPDNY